MAIVGILIAFILIAAQDGIRRAEEKATQSLIQKLEAGVSERLEAILLRRADISLGHQVVGATFNAGFTATNTTGDPNYNLVINIVGYAPLSSYPGAANFSTSIFNQQRAQAIAQFDLVRAELPDVFFWQSNSPHVSRYPLNFAGQDFPLGSGNFLIPLGAATTGTAPGQPNLAIAAPGDPNQAIGIFGATWQAAAGIYKNLGYLPQGYDGVDNAPSDGFVDDLNEGIGANPSVADPDNPSQTIQLSALIQRRLAAHKHVTARSEMLYALLVEGVGPLGSVFNRDEFTNREVQDTDGDGLPEFVDAWGQPLQFYRWPIYYNNLSSTTVPLAGYSATHPAPSGYVQKGSDPYNGLWDSQTLEPRQLDPLDPNQTLMAPAWWSSGINTLPATLPAGSAHSYNAFLFMTYFHSLLEPNASNSSPAGSTWDRAGFYPRRAFYSRPLIVSGGPDLTPGIARFFSANESPGSLGSLLGVSDGSGDGRTLNAANIVQIENQAAALDPSARSGALSSQIPLISAANQTTLGLLQAAGDDITNQALASPTGGVR